MKRILTVLSVMAVSALFSVIGVLAADNVPNPYGEDYGNLMSPPVKNECLLVARNCVSGSTTVQERVNDLRKEISRGLDVYTPSELRSMGEQLKWIETESGNDSM